MDLIIAAILEIPNAKMIIFLCFALLPVFFVVIYSVAFYQGRLISFWPMKIGSKPTLDIMKSPSAMKLAAAAFCYRKKGKSFELLLVQTSGRRWTFPKGRVKNDPDPYLIAEKNALEEGGVGGKISKNSFFEYKHCKQELKLNQYEEHHISIFFLEVTSQTEPIEKHRLPTWFSFKEAISKLSEGRNEFYSTEFKKVIETAQLKLISLE